MSSARSEELCAYTDLQRIVQQMLAANCYFEQLYAVARLHGANLKILAAYESNSHTLEAHEADTPRCAHVKFIFSKSANTTIISVNDPLFRGAIGLTVNGKISGDGLARNASPVRRLQTDAYAEIKCVDKLKFMRRLPDESMNLIVTSPPYNLGKEYEERLSQDKYIEEQSACIAEAVRLLHPAGSICWQVGNHIQDGEVFPLDIILYQLFKNHRLQLRNRIVWTFGHGLHCQKRFSGRHEAILWFTKSDDYIFNLDAVRVPSKYPEKKHFKGPNKGLISSNPLGKNPSDVWDIPNVKSNHVEKTDHPCQFPVGLVERLVLSLTNPGDSVLDPYIGVGSSAIAALKHGRNAYGCDLEKSYIDVAWERIHRLRAGELRTRPMDKPIYQPPIKCKE